ncbi:hypothetical protein SLS55_009661 [Diplodia seriata]|uniref:Aminotransferase n=1 Tax=Diplodia seriata TaxID=420778 RepID=A0ABR3C3A4_9PEZI
MHRALRSEPLRIVSGARGIAFTLSDGRTLLDASSGPGVSCLGHHQPSVARAVADQINRIGYVYSIGYTSEPAEELAAMLLRDRPGGLSRAMFFNSGSEATDAAVKLATQYWAESGEAGPSRRNVISRAQSYHGNTIGALCVSGHRARREMYADWLSGNVSFVDPCYAYRAKPEGWTDEEYVARLIKQLDEEFQRLGPDTVAAFFAETISGTTLGCVTALPGYFKGVRELCDRYGALLVLDEAHPTACAAAIEVQKIIERDGLLENCRKMGALLGELMEAEILPLPLVGDVRGRGLYYAAEFVLDKQAKTAFPVGEHFSTKVVAAASELGLNILGNLGKTGPIDVEHVMITPPYIITEAEVVRVVQLLKQAIQKASEAYL